MTSQLNPEFIRRAISETEWNFGNQILYDLCRTNPDHRLDDVIIGKIWLIGRSYAAAIERRRNSKSALGDSFYETEVALTIRRSKIDKWFRAIRTADQNDLMLHLETHARVMGLFTKISGLEKRSLASKYLHFHFPERFYIYDSRAYRAISELTKPVGKRLPALRKHDGVYARFVLRCEDLHQRIASMIDRPVSPREFDTGLAGDPPDNHAMRLVSCLPQISPRKPVAHIEKSPDTLSERSECAGPNRSGPSASFLSWLRRRHFALRPQ